mmetsp:Transcript_5333/g.13484  ORF Transcript_5333/g.13484 Transcript_5333/m.13484 type:complete len:213 (+) Transcript_5333:1631-2269(+)
MLTVEVQLDILHVLRLRGSPDVDSQQSGRRPLETFLAHHCRNLLRRRAGRRAQVRRFVVPMPGLGFPVVVSQIDGSALDGQRNLDRRQAGAIGCSRGLHVGLRGRAHANFAEQTSLTTLARGQRNLSLDDGSVHVVVLVAFAYVEEVGRVLLNGGPLRNVRDQDGGFHTRVRSPIRHFASATPGLGTHSDQIAFGLRVLAVCLCFYSSSCSA